MDNKATSRCSSLTSPTYILYDWQGKCRWAYLNGHFLVDPRFETEFINSRNLNLDLLNELSPNDSGEIDSN